MSNYWNGFYYNIGEGAYLDNQSEIENNVLSIYRLLRSYGFTKQAACGVIGNIDRESSFNPGQKTGDAWGLTQFYPSSRLTAYCQAHGYPNWWDGNVQCELINAEGYFTDTSGPFERQWLNANPPYNINWDTFKSLTDTEFAAKDYMWQNERPGTDTSEERARRAIEWEAFIDEHEPDPPVPPTPTTFNPLKLIFQLMLPDWL